MKGEKIVSLFGIDIFRYIAFAEQGTYSKNWYYGTEFLFDSLAKYNNEPIELTSDWDIIVWGECGRSQFNIIDVPEFKEKLREVLDKK